MQPTTIEGILGPVPKAYALIAGLQLDVFSMLQNGPLPVDELARAVGGEPNRLSSLLYYLVDAGLLMFSDGRFANTPESDRYLVRGRPGSYANQAGLQLEQYLGYAKVAEPIRAGRGLAHHDFATMSRDTLATILRGLDARTRDTGAWLASSFDFTGYRSLIDVGGDRAASALR